MDLIKLLFAQLLILKVVLQVDGFVDPLTLTTAGAIIAGVSYLLKNEEYRQSAVKFAHRTVERACQLIGVCEGCEDYWIHANLQGLEYDLKRQVIGQSLAVETILSALKSHLSSKRRRSLVLSFQGSPGTGKNFASEMILKNLFKKGDGSKYATFFRGSIDFPSNAGVHKYKEVLTRTIKEKVYECHRSVFVFDEVEKMPNGLLDIISGFVSAEKYGDYDYRRVIFILLSNVGSEALNRRVLQNWENGIPRDYISPKDLTTLLAKEAYNNEGGLKNTRLVKNYDISHFVPFLPLEKQHVVECIKQEIASRNQIVSAELIGLVVEELTFFPEDGEIFSTHGCKGIGEKLDFQIERESRKKRSSELEL